MASARLRLASVALAGVLPLSLAACGDDDPGGTEEQMTDEEMTDEEMTDEEMTDEG